MIHLASKSARRKELLKQAKIPFRVVRSNFHEKTFPGGPRKTVILNAIGKLKNARVNATKGFVLGVDTIVYCRGKIFGKPKNKKHAVQMLKALSRSRHAVYSGVALKNLETNQMETACVITRVTMKKLSDDEIRRYFSRVSPLDKAGAYAVQEQGDQIIKKINGSYTNVVGLPMEKLRSMLTSFKKEKK